MQEHTKSTPESEISAAPTEAAPVPKRQDETRLAPEYVAAHADVPAQPPSGGDFYTAFPTQDGEGGVSVIIGDVAGHGPEQALQAEHMRELISDCVSVGLTPAETLTAVNAMVEQDPNFAGFATVFVGSLEPGTGKLTYASGGHEPALIAVPTEDESAQVEELIGTGPPVGAFPADMARFEQHEALLPTGGTLLLYTDGISDARPPHDRRTWLGLDRLKEIFSRVASLSPRRLVSTVLKRVAAFAHGQFHDDVAIMAVRRLTRRRPARPSKS